MKKILIAVIIASIITGLFFITKKSEDNTHIKKVILNEQQLEPYMNIKGWKVTKISCDTVKIPQSFTGSYTIFVNEMKKSGYDIEQHKGENVKRYTYNVDNYGESGVIAELLLTDDNELISAAIIQQKINGFIKPL